MCSMEWNGLKSDFFKKSIKSDFLKFMVDFFCILIFFWENNID